MTASVILSDTFGNFKDKTNELIAMSQVVGMDNYIKVNDLVKRGENYGKIYDGGDYCFKHVFNRSKLERNYN